MTASTSTFKTALAVAQGYDLDTAPERWEIGEPFTDMDFRPGSVVLIGAPPNVGKSTLTMQLVAQLLERRETLRAVVANVEMSQESLLEKLPARYAQVPLDGLMDRTLLAEERARVDAVLRDRVGILERLAYLAPPFSISHLAHAMQDHSARLAVVDYLQRFSAEANEDRARLDKLMDGIRILARAGACVIVISSVARQKSMSGSSTYTGLTMASFRGTSEIEYGADSAFILHRLESVAYLQCVKRRFGQFRDVPLWFDGAMQTFRQGNPLDGFDAAPTPEKVTPKKRASKA